MNKFHSLLSILLIAGFLLALGGPVEAQSLQENSEPISDAGLDQVVIPSTLVTLDGSASSDPDGNLPLTYLWTQTAGTAVTLTNADTAAPSFTAPNALDTLTFSLTVTDSLGMPALAADEVTITVDYNYVYLPIIMTPIPPDPYSKSGPVNYAVDQSVTPTLSWISTSPLSYYEYCFDTTDDDDCSSWINNAKSTSVILPELTPNTTYYWQVRAWNNSVGPTYANGSSTDFWSFTTIQFPGSFSKNSPSTGVIDQLITPTLSWESTSPVTSYEYCYAITNYYPCRTWYTNGTSTSVTLPPLAPNYTYYWQVRAWNGIGGPTYANDSATAFWSFKTVQFPANFQKKFPYNGSPEVLITPTLSWNPTSQVTSYEYCYDTTNDNLCTDWISNGLSTFVTLPPLSPLTKYYWQVRAWNGIGGPTYADNSASSFWSFTVKPPWSNMLFEDFETDFPGEWDLFSWLYDEGIWYDVTSEISWGKNDCMKYDGLFSGRAVGGGNLWSGASCGAGYPANIENWMIYGPVDLTQVKDGYLSMNIWLDVETNHDKLFWGISLDGENFYGQYFTGYSQGWISPKLELKNIDTLGDVTGQSQVWIGILFESDSSDPGLHSGAWVDDISLVACNYSEGCYGTPLTNASNLPLTGLVEGPASKSTPTRDFSIEPLPSTTLEVPWFDLADFMPEFK